MLEKLFRLSENNTTVRTEILAGVTTFMTMSYIIFVQPAVLSTTGMDFQAVLAATCIVGVLNVSHGAAGQLSHRGSSCHGSQLLFCVHGCGGDGIFVVALGAVFISGVVFLIM